MHPDGSIRIADFGLSVYADGHSGNYFSLRSGNMRWLAPEIILPHQYNPAASNPAPGTNLAIVGQPVDGVVRTTVRPTKESDVYSFACVCIEVSGNIDRCVVCGSTNTLSF